MENLNWHTEKRRVQDLKLWESNPRILTKAQAEKLYESIQKFNLVEIPAIDLDDRIVAGHQRVTILLGIGRGGEEIEVRVPNRKLTEEEYREYNIRSNKNTGEWDMEKLATFDKDLLQTAGFETNELDRIFRKKDHEDDFDAAAEAEKITVPKAKKGDIYELGRHRLMCGDSTSIEDVAKLMNNQKADMVFTDPPYNVDYSGKGEKTSNTILNDKMSEAEFEVFLTKVFEAYKTAVKISAPFYVCHSSSSQITFELAMKKTDLIVKNQIIWNKTIASMGWGDYRWKHEPIFYATYGKKATSFYGDRTEYTVWNESWDIDRIEKHLKRIAEKQEKGGSTVWTIGRDSNYAHPTQKPIELITIALSNSSKRDDVVLDLFGGSGSTLVGCEKLERSCYTMELDPKYVDVIIARYEKLTDEVAKKVSETN